MGTQHWGPGWEHGSRERDQVKSAVIETCEAAGLKSVCTGGPGCKHYHPDKCVVTPLSYRCTYPLSPLEQVLCPRQNGGYCRKAEGIFTYLAKGYSDAWGITREGNGRLGPQNG